MMFTLDYDKMRLLDAEGLAEGGILRAYQSIREILPHYRAEPAQIQEVIDDDKRVRSGAEVPAPQSRLALPANPRTSMVWPVSLLEGQRL